MIGVASCVCGRIVSFGPAAGAGAAGFHGTDFQGVPVRFEGDECADAAGGSAEGAEGRLPGLCASADCVSAVLEFAGAVCERVFADVSAAGPGAAGGGGCFACVGFGVLSGGGMAG